MSAVPRAMLFDLDGTLVDSAHGIAWAVNRTLAELGHPAADETLVRTWIGEGARFLLQRALRHAGADLPDGDAFELVGQGVRVLSENELLAEQGVETRDLDLAQEGRHADADAHSKAEHVTDEAPRHGLRGEVDVFGGHSGHSLSMLPDRSEQNSGSSPEELAVSSQSSTGPDPSTRLSFA